MATAVRCAILFAMTLLIGAAAAQEAAQPRHWAEGRWESPHGGQAGTLVIARAADGRFTVRETVKADKWNDPRSLGQATIEVAGDTIRIEDDLGNVFKLQRIEADRLEGTLFILRYQTHMLKTRSVTYVRTESGGRGSGPGAGARHSPVP